MKNKYKVVALVPLEFSVEGSSDSKEAIESVKNIFEACRNDNDCADIVFDGIEESLRHDSIEYKVEAAQPEPEVKKTVSILCVTMQTKSKTEKQTKAARCCMAWNIGILSKMSSSV